MGVCVWCDGRWQYLAGRDLTQHEALAKQLADVLDFIIQFDYEKMMKTGREGGRESALAEEADRGHAEAGMRLVG